MLTVRCTWFGWAKGEEEMEKALVFNGGTNWTNHSNGIWTEGKSSNTCSQCPCQQVFEARVQDNIYPFKELEFCFKRANKWYYLQHCSPFLLIVLIEIISSFWWSEILKPLLLMFSSGKITHDLKHSIICYQLNMSGYVTAFRSDKGYMKTQVEGRTVANTLEYILI